MNQTSAHYMLHLLVIKEGAIYYFIFGVRNIINAGKKKKSLPNKNECMRVFVHE